MKSRMPPAPNRLPSGMPRSVVVADAEVDDRVLHAHVVKHVLGAVILHRRWGSKAKPEWDVEGWSGRLGRDREALFALRASLADLEADGERCGYGRRLTRPVFGGDLLPEQPCYACVHRLAARCRERTRDLRDAYVDVTVRVLDAARETVLVGRRAASGLVRANVWPGHGPLLPSARDAVLVSFDIRPAAAPDGSGAPPRVRIATGDGVRVELQLDGSSWRWRTTYGEDLGSPTRLFTFLWSTLGQSSDPVAVPRRWVDAGKPGL